MEQQQHLEVLHAIDKRLAVLEAMSEQHSLLMEVRLKELKSDVKKLMLEMVTLKIRVAGISAVISMIITGAISWLSR